MSTLCFILTMPNRGSWNGRWSGENNLYAVCKPMARSKKAGDKVATLDGQSFYYRWNDGWGANVSVRKVSASEARSIRSKSKGFCGYDWMIDSILQYGGIYTEAPKEQEEIA